MLLDWTRHLADDEAKKNFEATVKNSTLVLDRLYDLMKEKEDNLSLAENTTSQYSTPEWSALQAHRNGNREILKWVKDLLTL